MIFYDTLDFTCKHDFNFRLRSMFNFNRLKESFLVAFKRREGGLRHVIVICLSLFGMYSIANNSLGPVNIPYAKAKFEWKNGKLLLLFNDSVHQREVYPMRSTELSSILQFSL